MKITKKEFDKLYDKNITKRDYDEIQTKIINRCVEIMRYILPPIPNGWWWDFSNGGHEDTTGYFDEHTYKEWVMVVGDKSNLLPAPYYDAFPTRWLWENYEREYEKAVKDEEEKKLLEKQKTKLVAEIRKQEKKELITAIKAKLTKEELKVVRFK